jgi:hypothetical protein
MCWLYYNKLLDGIDTLTLTLTLTRGALYETTNKQQAVRPIARDDSSTITRRVSNLLVVLLEGLHVIVTILCLIGKRCEGLLGYIIPTGQFEREGRKLLVEKFLYIAVSKQVVSVSSPLTHSVGQFLKLHNIPRSLLARA